MARHQGNDDVQREIDSNARIRDAIPETVPSTLARELVNQYPAEVKQHKDRLASLAGDIIRRERAAVAEERAARLEQASELHRRVQRAELQVTAAKQEAAEVRERLDAIVARVERFGRRSGASKRMMVDQVVAMARAPLSCRDPSASST